MGDGQSGLRSAMIRHGIVLVPSGTLCREMANSLMAECDILVGVSELREECAASGQFLGVEGLDELSEDRSSELGQVRATVDALRDSGVYVALFSKCPIRRYRAVPGSSIVVDAKLYFPGEVQVGRGRKPCEIWSGIDEDANMGDLLLTSLEELGPECARALDEAIFERMAERQEVLGELEASVVEDLRRAGLVGRNGETAEWVSCFFWSEFKEALSRYLVGIVRPLGNVQAVYEELWTVERLVRRALHFALVKEGGPRWRRAALHGDLSSRALDRATVDAYPGSSTVSDLRDPLEWLSLGELLELRSQSQVGLLGLTEKQWDRFAKDVLPVRNRVSHMRIPTTLDLNSVRGWKRILSANLKIEE